MKLLMDSWLPMLVKVGILPPACAESARALSASRAMRFS
eukprot:CAMPEP_0183458580 /NCGR_PEP_ID=MMETSP0370-20130417/133820_1 /TAXON_ID=268820 /ORGANISM="Peridinium aciculiferum, Strain PAER-2" /LENGTH=38 /DNA_ID= /DNA_START= /DNA_END= /DNA_ORIENTATION=